MKTIILGPPGTGKTTTLLNLVDDFMKSGVDAKRIGYFSFTRKAAHEAASRAAEKFNLDQTEDLIYFRMEDFYTFAKRNNWEMDKTKTGNLIKQLKGIFVEEVRMTLKNQTPRVVKIVAMKDNGASISKVTYQESPF